MKLQVSSAGRLHAFTAYGEGYVEVDGQRHVASLVVLPERVAPWPVPGFEALAEAHFEALAALAPEVVLLGTGATLRFPHPSLLRPLARARIGFETMDTRAACRTYNVLVAEGRKVAAALLLG